MADTAHLAARPLAAGARWAQALDWPLHPILLPIYLILTSAAVNADEAAPEDFTAVAACMLGLAVILFFCARLAVRDWRKAGIVATPLFAALVLYGWVLPVESGFMLWDHLLVPVWIAGFGVLTVALARRRDSLAFITRTFNIITGVIVLSAAVTVALRLGQSPGPLHLPEIPAAQLAMVPEPGSAAGPLPDIYYLIFDRYGDARTLSTVYGYDNGGFLNRLRGKGFYVAEDSAANYTKTGLSLASSLNIQHLNALTPRGRRSDWKPVYGLLDDPLVWRFLRSRGYRYTHVGSWWGATRRNDSADRNIEETVTALGVPLTLSRTEWFFADRTWLFRALNLVQPLSHFARSHAIVGRQLAALRGISRDEGPNFVFAHFLVPHEPFVFARNGDYKPLETAVTMPRERNYIDQLVYINGEIERLVDDLLSRPGPKPIVIVQADEGPYPARYVAGGKDFNWGTATEAEMRQKFRILNAIYLPEAARAALYPRITPVNTFRVVFNEVFGQHLPLLPDSTYTFDTEADIYAMRDITGIVH